VKFDPYQRSAQNVYLAAAVTDVVDSKIPVQILNINPYPVTLYENSKLGNVKVYVDQNADSSYNDQLAEALKRWIKQNVNITDDIPGQIKHELLSLLAEYPNLYAIDDKDCGRTTLVQHTINTGDSNPVRKFPYRISPKEKDIRLNQLYAKVPHLGQRTSCWSRRRMVATGCALIFAASTRSRKKMSIVA